MPVHASYGLASFPGTGTIGRRFRKCDHRERVRVTIMYVTVLTCTA